MILDAALAYLHFTAIFLLFSFLTVQIVLVRAELDEAGVRRLGRMDIWYFGSAAAALLTGFLRLGLGAKGPDFYLNAWPVYAKLLLFLVVGAMSVKPTLTFIRWRRAFEHDPAWKVPAAEQAAIRKTVMAEVHIAALIPAFAVIMSRGLGS